MSRLLQYSVSLASVQKFVSEHGKDTTMPALQKYQLVSLYTDQTASCIVKSAVKAG